MRLLLICFLIDLPIRLWSFVSVARNFYRPGFNLFLDNTLKIIFTELRDTLLTRAKYVCVVTFKK